MSAKEDITAPLLPGRYYHIFNRGNNKNPIFQSEENFRFFLRRYFQYSAEYWDTFGYCLIDNHFHILIGIKPVEELEDVVIRDFKKINLTFIKHRIWPLLLGVQSNLKVGVESNEKDREIVQILYSHLTDLTDLKDLLDLVGEKNLTQLKTEILSWAISERFRSFMLSYAKAFNKKYERTGSLFQKAFRRKELKTMEDRKLVLAYIHHNPIHHGYTNKMHEYPWTSYHYYSSKPKSHEIKYIDGLEWFGSYEGFNNFSLMYQAWRQNDMINQLE